MEIELPDGTVLEAPDDADPSVVAKNYLAKQKPAAPIAPQEPRTGFQHTNDLLGTLGRHPFSAGIGLAENGLSSVTGGFGSLAEAVMGKDPGTFDTAYRPRTEVGREIAGLGGEEMGRIGQKYDQYAGTGPLAQTLKERLPQAAGAVGTITGVTGLRGIAGGRVPVNARPGPAPVLSADVGGEALAAPAAPGVTNAAQRAPRLAPLSEAPTKKALSDAADAAYKRADESGVVVKPESFDSLKSRIVEEVRGIDPTLHPDSTAALKRITEATGEQSLNQLETLRRIASDAEDSIKPADRRLAAKITDQLDEYIDNLTEGDVVAGNPEKTKALKEARDLYSRKKKADELDRLVERAELSAPNFSASGMENALRTEFRALAKNERRMRRFTKEEQEAIKRVAKGGAMENALRMLGKLAPTGVVSGALSSGAGFLTGGPIGAVAVPVAGAAARYGATRMTLRNAALANELVRRGPMRGPATTRSTALADAIEQQ